MELFDSNDSREEWLVHKAETLRIPIGGTMELLPLCNMNCSMCYVQDNTQSIRERLLSVDSWLEIARQMKEAGVLFLLITGGEPLLYPGFKELYVKLLEMGFIISVNTNGTLLDEEWAGFFAEHRCRRLNISLYGASNETYGRLCHNPCGFDQTMKALHLLKERNIPVRISISLVNENREDLNRIVEIANEMNMPFLPAAYMFPPVRRGYGWEVFSKSRMKPEDAAQTRIRAIMLRNPQVDLQQQAKMLLDKVTGPIAFFEREKGFSCRAGSCGFWINWLGELLPCGMLKGIGSNLLENTFKEAWDHVVKESAEIRTCLECEKCRKKMFCQTCAAACLTETGRFEGKPQYLCDVTDEMIRILLASLDDEDRKEYTTKVKIAFPDLL